MNTKNETYYLKSKVGGRQSERFKQRLYLMKQFYETYKNNEFVSTLLTQISWSNTIRTLKASLKSRD